jgi:hypothetical protein
MATILKGIRIQCIRCATLTLETPRLLLSPRFPVRYACVLRCCCRRGGAPRGGRRARLIYVMLGVVLTFVIASRSECRFTNEKSVMAEGVGLSPTICKALKINARFRSYVVQDYRTSVPSGKGVFLIRNSIRSQKSPGVPDRTAKAHKLSLDSKSA